MIGGRWSVISLSLDFGIWVLEFGVLDFET